MRRLLLIPFAAVALVAAAALSGVGRPEAARGEDAPQRDTVTTLGRGTVTTVPDLATISAGVRSDAPTAAEALAQNSEHMERVVAALRHAGGTKLQTQQVSLYPRTGDNGATVGFVAQNSVSAQAKIAGTGTLVDAAVAAGANTVEGPMLERSDRETLYRDALERALKDARLKAEALARAGGFDVGSVASVVEEGASQVPVYERAARAADAAAPTPVEPGTQEIEARVTVSFEIS